MNLEDVKDLILSKDINDKNTIYEIFSQNPQLKIPYDEEIYKELNKFVGGSSYKMLKLLYKRCSIKYKPTLNVWN